MSLRIAALLFLFVVAADPAKSQYQYLSPAAGSTMVNPEHNILLRQGEPFRADEVSREFFLIEGAKSQIHDFEIHLSADQRTIILSPATPFDFDEKVTVSIQEGLKTESGKSLEPFSYSFFTHRKYSQREKLRIDECRRQRIYQSIYAESTESAGATVRSPVEGGFEIKENRNATPGDIFFDSWNSAVWYSEFDGYHIINTDGDSVYSNSGTRNRSFEWDLNPNGYLACWNVDVPCYDILDSNYNLIDQFTAANGYYTDPHEFTMYEDGHIILLAEEPQIVDMTVYTPGYSDSCLVTGTVIQEFDEKRNLVFEWRSFDHVELTETNQPMYYGWLDYIHTNSLEIDEDGNLIVSHRHLDEISKIDRSTGEFIWRMGGKMNEFTFINDLETFSYQHDVRRIANGNITLWDNGNKHAVPHSSAKEYQVDETNKTATLVWSFAPYDSVSGKPAYFLGMGSVQRLENGNTFINGGWDAGQPQSNMWEVTPSGEVVWELKLSDDAQLVSYRAHKYEWNPCASVLADGVVFNGSTSRTASLTWPGVHNAVSYDVQFRLAGEKAWEEQVSGDTIATLKYLNPESRYEYRIRARCENGFVSDWTPTYTFTTALTSLYPQESILNITIHPVPAADNLTIQLSIPVTEEISANILDMEGQQLYSTSIHLEHNIISAGIDVSFLPPGYYFLRATTGDTQAILPFIIER